MSEYDITPNRNSTEQSISAPSLTHSRSSAGDLSHYAVSDLEDNRDHVVPPCSEGDLRLRDLAVDTIQIGHNDVSHIMRTLTTLGYETISLDEDGRGQMGDGTSDRYSCEKLPIVLQPQQVDDSRLGFEMEDFNGAGGRGFSGDGDSSPALHPLAKPHSAEVDHILVFYHPEKIHELHRLENLITNQLDKPASQIYIEGMVLEVSEGGLRELGIRYSRLNDELGLSIGALEAVPVAGGGSQVLSAVRSSIVGEDGIFPIPNQSLLELQALVSEGSAEVLSRPSVLTLNNRQATIQIIDIVQFPIQEATITSSGEIVQSAFSFEAVRPGITLNLRPRASADKRFISMEIDVTVEALVTANNGNVINDKQEIVATKPGTSARRVQTFARIPDRTPIIIGGLIATDKETIENKVPLLGNLPGVGFLFGGAKKRTFAKREVIIVLTPYLVGDDSDHGDVSMPRDTSLFDVSNSQLFNDTYRVRSEDLYDLNFILKSSDFIDSQKVAKEVADELGATRALRAPFKHFLNGDMPGGAVIIDRMIYDLVLRRNFGSEVDLDKLVVLAGRENKNPAFLTMADIDADLAENPGHAAVLLFDDIGRGQATADYSLVNGLQDQDLETNLANYSKPNSDGTPQSAIILRNRQDVESLRAVLAAGTFLNHNGGHKELTVGRFTEGEILSMPDFKEDRVYFIDDRISQIYNHVHRYYTMANAALDDAYDSMEIELKEGLLEEIAASVEGRAGEQKSIESTLPESVE